MDDGSRTRDLVLMNMTRAQLGEHEEFILRAIRLARHTNADASTLDVLVDRLEAVTFEEQCRIDEGNVYF